MSASNAPSTLAPEKRILLVVSVGPPIDVLNVKSTVLLDPILELIDSESNLAPLS